MTAYITLLHSKTKPKRAYFYELKHVSIVELLNFIEQLEVQAKHIFVKHFNTFETDLCSIRSTFLVSYQETKSQTTFFLLLYIIRNNMFHVK